MASRIDEKHQADHRQFWDRYAASYDSTTTSPVSYSRRMSIAILKRNFSSGQRLLEICAGTGHLSCRAACGWVAAWSSRTTRAKCFSHGASETGPTSSIVPLPAESVDSFRSPFDGAYSSFGVINCLEDLSVFFRRLHGSLKAERAVRRFVRQSLVSWRLRLVRASPQQLFAAAMASRFSHLA